MKTTLNKTPKDGWKLKRDSFSYGYIVFNDNNIRTRYSLDWTHGHAKHRDFELGIEKLKKLIATYGNSVKYAHIVAVATKEELYTYEEGLFTIPQEPKIFGEPWSGAKTNNWTPQLTTHWKPQDENLNTDETSK